MSRIEASTLINKPAGDIFAFFSVPENHAKFIPGMLEFKQTSPGSFAQAGATARGVRRDFVLDTPVLYEITQVEADITFAMQGIMGPVFFEDGYVLEPLDGSTRVNFWLELTLRGPAKVGQPFLGLVGRIHAAETLANLKKVLETNR
jgi:carbon monoxide dehydrogenase subunit G